MGRPELADSPLALGRTAEIFPWDAGTVLKLFRPGFAAHAAYEARLARAVAAVKLPVPAVGKLVEVGGRPGIVYERVDGPTLLAAMAARPWRIGRYARLLAGLQRQLHETEAVQGLPSQQARLAGKIEAADGLDPALRQQALARLGAMPAGDRLCHGDFHPDNVILGEGDPVVIDWIDATLGQPLADVARTALLLEEQLRPGTTLTLPERLAVRWATRAYLGHYFRGQPGARRALAQWRPLVAAGRLSEGIAAAEGWLREQVVAGLAAPAGTS